jgi:hypothetical protein
MTEKKYCPYGVPKSEACSDDACFDCQFLKEDDKDILCKCNEWDEGEVVQFD